MEDPLSSERAAAVRRDNVWESVRDGIGVDGERQYQRVREGGSQRGSVRTRMFLVQSPYARLSPMIA